VVDEAAFIPPGLLDDVLWPMLATTDGTLTLISTPNGHNAFWRYFEMGLRSEHGVWSRQSPTLENPRVHPEFLETQRVLVSPRTFEVEYEAVFHDVGGRVFTSASIQDAQDVTVPRGEGPWYAGVDYARYRDFMAVVVIRGHLEDAAIVHVERFQGLRWDESLDRVAEILGEFPGCSVACDATGAGDIATSFQPMTTGKAHALTPVVFNATNKAQMIDRLAALLERRVLKMRPHPVLQEELRNFIATPREFLPPLLRAQGTGHDDLVIALALAVSRLPSPGTGVRTGSVRSF
jgi:hypothetical protein